MLETSVEIHCTAVVTSLLVPSDMLAVAVSSVVWPIAVSVVFPPIASDVTTPGAGAGAGVAGGGADGDVGVVTLSGRLQPASAVTSTTVSKCGFIGE